MLRRTLGKVSLFFLFGLIVLGFSIPWSSAVSADLNQKVVADYAVVEINVNEDGTVDINSASLALLNANLSIFQISLDSETYAELSRISIAISFSDQGFYIETIYFGDVYSNATYLSWAQTIRDNVKSFFAFSFSNEQFTSYYDPGENVSLFIWTYTFATTDLWSKLQSLVEYYVQGDFSKFLVLDSTWDFDQFGFKFSKTFNQPNSTGTVFMLTTASKTVFSGNGTHSFNLQELVGYNDGFIGVPCLFTINLPYDANINSDTIDVGNATVLSLTSNQLVVQVDETQTIGSLSFQFDYNFIQTDTGESGDTGDTGETNETQETSSSTLESAQSFLGTFLGGSTIYAVGGIIAIGIIITIIKSFLRKQR